MSRVYLFKRFERFWHWSQAALVLFMLLTGFEIHGTYRLFGWEEAGSLHRTAAWTLIALWAFAIFWHFTTGEWKQYLPTTKNLIAVAQYYSMGMFRGERHPHQVTALAKHNPLQRVAYLIVKLVINPLLWVSGLLYLYYAELAVLGLGVVPLRPIALAHTAAAFMMLIFTISHIYLATTGHTPLAHLKAMITGWQEDEGAHAGPPA
jgi:thiosulfate reductase cytochrome b subunit